MGACVSEGGREWVVCEQVSECMGEWVSGEWLGGW